MKHIVIISCDPGLKEINESYGIAAEWIQDKIGIDLYKFSVFKSFDGEIPRYYEGDAWIITGSSASVYEDKEWIVEMEIAIQRAFEVNKPILGICFGHQLIAQSLGGTVINNYKGWELGSYQLNYTTAGKESIIFNQINESDYFYQSHQDVISMLPVSAKLLAENDLGIQSFSYGSRIFGVQFHPEFNHEIMIKYATVREGMGATINDPNIPESKNSSNIITNFLTII